MGRPISYDAYVREYTKEAAKHDMYAPMFDETTFEAVYEGMANSMRDQGLRVQNVTRTIVQKQSYELSYKQARAFKKARENLGMEGATIKSIRQMSKSEAVDWATVKNMYRDYKELVGAVNAKELVAQVVFGSE